LIETDTSFAKASRKVLSEWVETLKSGESTDENQQAA